MKYIIGLIFLCSSFSIQSQNILRDQAIKDINYLVASLESIHPNLYAYTSKEDISRAVEELKSSIPREGIDTRAFSLNLSEMVALFKEGHTEVRFRLQEFRSFIANGGKVFPLSIGIMNGRVFIRDKTSRYNHHEIISINGSEVSQLIEKFKRITSAEKESFKDAVIEKRFSRLCWSEFGNVENFNLLLSFEGKHYQVPIQASGYDVVRAKLKTNNYSLEVINKDIAFIDFDDMSDLSKFKKFLKESFDNINESGIDTLIIDLRNNPGGDSRLGDELISYIYDGKYRQVDNMNVKSSKLQKRYFRKNYIKPYLYPLFPLVFLHPVGRATFGKNGKEHSIDFKEKNAAGSIQTYRGVVYVLVSNFTYSSAHILANAIDHYNMGTIMGEETGSFKVFFGDNVEFQLPDSKIVVSSSFKEFMLPGRNDSIEVSVDIRMEDVIEKSYSEIVEAIRRNP